MTKQSDDALTLIQIGTEIRKLQVSVASLRSALAALAGLALPNPKIPDPQERAKAFLKLLQKMEQDWLSADTQVKEFEIAVRALRVWQSSQA